MLKDQTFEYRYSKYDKHKPAYFCEVALSNSCMLQLGMGYFSSASFNVLANGLARFISQGGKMCLYINQYISKEDFYLLKNNDTTFDEKLIESYQSLKKTFSVRDRHFFECVSYLIQTNRIEIKIIVLDNGALPHEKYGIFTDANGDKVEFIGSMNFTASGLIENGETFDCICSWTNDENLNRVLSLEKQFNDVWTGARDGAKVYEARRFCTEIVREYPDADPERLLAKERSFIEENIPSVHEVSLTEPHFPTKFKDGPLPYQEEAYSAWCERGKKGIFAMATGTGKTVTSLNCALHEYEEDRFYHLIILAPTRDLVVQWKAEIESFNFKKIIIVSSLNSKWRQDVASLAYRVSRKNDTNFVIVSTYNSFTDNDFQSMLPKLSNNTILIADEAHNIGGNQVKNCFRQLSIDRMIALSATPNRIYDEEGSKEIESFFNDTIPYTYSFPMSKAINEGRLTEYFYYPKIAYLNNNEMEEYQDLTSQLMSYIDQKTKKYKECDRVTRLLMQRKNIIHKAEDKLRVYKEIIQEIGEDKLKYAFVYSPRGSYEGDEEEISFIQKLLDETKSIFPKKKCNTFTGKNDKQTRSELLKSFANGVIDILFAMKCLDEGVDVPRAEIGIFTSSTGNPREFIQRRGRLLRKSDDKKYAYIYDIIVAPSPSSYDNNKTEQNLIRAELERVAYFANLAKNNRCADGALEKLSPLALRYGLSLTQILNEINQ
ncbi:MAG: DEAD/DEAH box helicase family protein [Bacteroidaceae bacterium]|nr:DEAD/DEAH box helicase family protein [Bacteroidaceae bacterium]